MKILLIESFLQFNFIQNVGEEKAIRQSITAYSYHKEKDKLV